MMIVILLQETFLAVILLLIYSFLQSFPFFSTRACHSRLNMKQISAKIIFVYTGFSVKVQTLKVLLPALLKSFQCHFVQNDISFYEANILEQGGYPPKKLDSTFFGY